LEDFTLLKVLGTGAFGKVFLVEKKSKTPGNKSKYYAMKVLRKDFIIAKSQCAHTMTERRILEEIVSPFIVKLAYAF
jgi:serine/threonine protein kinase